MVVQPVSHDAKLASALDDFIAEQLPDWLKTASPQAINRLRERFAPLHAVQQSLRVVLDQLEPLEAFATRWLERRVTGLLPQARPLHMLTWRETRMRFAPPPFSDPSLALPESEPFQVRQPALQRLLQNFEAGASFYEGTALVDSDSDTPVKAQVSDIVTQCRNLDVGRLYQEHLEQVFTPLVIEQQAREQQLSLQVALEIAVLRRQLPEADVRFLRAWAQGLPVQHDRGRHRAMGLTLMGCRIGGALAIEIRDDWSPGGGPITLPGVAAVLLYLPGEPQPLQRFDDWQELAAHLGTCVRQLAFRKRLLQRVALAERAAFIATLSKRLGDSQVDVDAGGERLDGDVCLGLARHHCQRIKDDARWLAVPTADVDHARSQSRIEALEQVGVVLLNVLGLFVPTVGALLFTQLIGQTLAEVFEGAADWARGRDHEALEHMLGVAETVAVTAALVLGMHAVARGFPRSALVDGMEPVIGGAGKPRLQSVELGAYRVSTPPANGVWQDNGLLIADGRWWWQDEHVTYEVHQVGHHWQLKHPQRQGGVHPGLRHNGERGWRLWRQRPLEWQGAQRMLGYLWPEAAQLDSERVQQILRVADVDEAQLRGLLVENRRLPVQLRDTLERFARAERIERFLGRVALGQILDEDRVWFVWCVDKLAVGELPLDAQFTAIDQAQARMREGLLADLDHDVGADQALLGVIMRDFPGLPKAYALRVLDEASDAQRAIMSEHARLPLAVAEQARALLQVARLTRVREAFYLPGSHREDALELVFDLLRRYAAWPQSANLELRRGSDAGPLLARLYPGDEALVLVHREGQFEIHRNDGYPTSVQPEAPAGLAEVLLACLPQAHRQRLGWDGADASGRLVADLQGWLPATREALMRQLGMSEIKPWLNPARRRADGRIGYALSGRSSGRMPAHSLLRWRLRGLYPSFDDAQLEQHLQRLLSLPGSPYSHLLAEEQAYRRLHDCLQTWIEQSPVPGQARQARQRIASQLRRCWRREGEQLPDDDGVPSSARLSLIGLVPGGLPTLPPGVSFGHVSELLLVGMSLEALPAGFLTAFREVRSLTLSNNRLTGLPAELQSLSRLQSLDLRNNRIRMNAGGLEVLRGLSQLDVLDLSDNPLRVIDLQISSLARLRRLYLRRAELRAIPGGIQWCSLLELADLRDNQIATLPRFMLQETQAFRRRLRLEGNPLSADDFTRLAQSEPRHPAAASAARGWRAWSDGLSMDAEEQLATQWRALAGEPGSTDFFMLLDALVDSSDYSRAWEDLRRRVVQMLQAMAADSRLRHELFELASHPRTCVDSIAHCFSTLEVRSMVVRALQAAPPGSETHARLQLGRQLFRLDRVEALARDHVLRESQAGRVVDEIEVSLAYRIGLAGPLGLPGQPRSMRFPTIARVTQADLNAAELAVYRAEAGGLAAYVSERDFWRECLRQREAQRFDALEQPFWQRLEALDLRRAELGDGAYLRQMQQLASEREAATQALILQLTEQALAASPLTESGR
ncbi:NEL-type E3 ubiquitin ligase domain-containing protein [Pseudomonas sp. NBRC 111130]|uniref:NEL-type E3 ubiquitin ligase domain-containing protein n=1 Tax=Pseudomonas sp. NBRC 111130 TaxID=1661045 RepID=UPI0006D41069|nr:NEL-type E3 ubiquitin ligase domain-containing protein [Pseudomonas sp. NBRC 111130]